MNVLTVVTRIAMFSWLLPVFYLVWNWRHHPPAFRWLLICQGMSFVMEFSSLMIMYFKISPNYIINPGAVLSITWISIFFYSAIGLKSLRVPFIVLNIAVLAFGVVNLFFIEKMSPNYHTYTLLNLVILLFCIVFYYRMLRDLPSIQVQRDPLFLVVSGWFFRHSGQIVLTLVSTYMFSILKDNMEILWTMFGILSIVGNLIVMVGAYFQFRIAKRTEVQAPQIR